MPEISVIVPVYNVEKYIHRCVDSILAQTFTDYELILVDDGSPDNCGVICDEYAKKDSRIRVVHKPNGGPSSARNAGLDIAQGKYIMFCDSDDYVAKNWCEKMLDAIAENTDAFVVSNLWKVNDSIESSYLPEKDELDHLTYFETYRYGISAYTFNKIYEANKLQNQRIRFDETCNFGEDVVFNVKYFSLCSRCIYIPTALYYYVNNSASIMNRYYPNFFELHLPLFWCRLSLIPETNKPEYCDIWLYQFLHLFNNVFDSRCTMTFAQKLRYNQRMIQSKEFRFCLKHATEKKEQPLVMKILRTHNYYLFWLFTLLTKIKNFFKELIKL